MVPQRTGGTESKRHGLFQWWYDKTSISDPPVNASFAQREAARKLHLLSTIVFWLLVTFILFILGCLALPNHYVIYADLGMLALCIPALFFNRAKKPQVAGILLTFAFEAALTMVVFTTWPSTNRASSSLNYLSLVSCSAFRSSLQARSSS